MLSTVLRAFLLICLVLPFRAEAQSRVVPRDPGGTDLRVTTISTGANPLIARGFVRGDSLVILLGDWVHRTIPLAEVEVLEVGRRSHLAGAWVGFWGGALVGATFGGALGILADGSGVRSEGDIPATPFTIAGGILLGAPIGMLVLGFRGLRRWAVIPHTGPASPSQPGATIHLRPQLDGRPVVRLNIPLP